MPVPQHTGLPDGAIAAHEEDVAAHHVGGEAQVDRVGGERVIQKLDTPQVDCSERWGARLPRQAREKLPQGRCSTVKASQLTIAPTTDMERPQISMSRKSLFLFALGPALAMNTAPVVESGERSTTKPHTMMDETSGRRSALDAPSCFRSGGAIGRKAGRITPVVLA